MSNILQLVQNSHNDIGITVRDATTKEAIDITGYTLVLTIKYVEDYQTNDDRALIQSTVTTHTSPSEGKTLFELTKAQCNIATGTYKYNIEVIDTGAKERGSKRALVEFLESVNQT